MDDELVGIYDADGGLVGELRYVVSALVGRAHWSLCDITHSWRGRKRRWDQACADAHLVVRLAHRNEVELDQLDAAGPLPAVIARRDGTWRLVLGPEELASCESDPDVFVERLVEALDRERG